MTTLADPFAADEFANIWTAKDMAVYRNNVNFFRHFLAVSIHWFTIAVNYDQLFGKITLDNRSQVIELYLRNRLLLRKLENFLNEIIGEALT